MCLNSRRPLGVCFVLEPVYDLFANRIGVHKDTVRGKKWGGRVPECLRTCCQHGYAARRSPNPTGPSVAFLNLHSTANELNRSGWPIQR